MAAAISILFSAVLLGLIGWQDPKRRRALPRADRAGYDAPMWPARLHQAFAWLVTLPGIALAISGRWWAFVVWFGVSCIIGWAIAQLLSIASDE